MKAWPPGLLARRRQPISRLHHHSRSPMRPLPAPLPLNTPEANKSQSRKQTGAMDHLRPQVRMGCHYTPRPAGCTTKLIDAAAASKNEALAKAVAAFTALMPAMRTALIEAVEIVDGAPLLADLDAVIEDRLRMIAPRGKAPTAREYLEGWWWPRV